MGSIIKKCSGNCNKVFDDKFCYCPFCGELLLPYNGPFNKNTNVSHKDILLKVEEIVEEQRSEQLGHIIYTVGMSLLILGFTILISYIFNLTSGLSIQQKLNMADPFLIAFVILFIIGLLFMCLNYRIGKLLSGH